MIYLPIITNTDKHAKAGMYACLAMALIEKLISLIPGTIFHIGGFGLIILLVYSIRLEWLQFMNYVASAVVIKRNKKTEMVAYLKSRWLDIILDVCSALAAYSVVGWITGIL